MFADANNFICPIAVVLLSLQTAHGYPNGAPKSACDSMIPEHHRPGVNGSIIPPMQTDPPTVFIVDKGSVGPGDMVRMTLKAKAMEKKEEYASFRGFLIEVRRKSDDSIVGKFVEFDDETTKSVDCSGEGSQNAITHTNAGILKNEILATWKAPKELGDNNTNNDDLVVYFTLAESHDKFWVKRQGASIKYSVAKNSAKNTSAFINCQTFLPAFICNRIFN